ncbi:23S rRNA (pseudouridine(1915)-N(3))-methyltransferase RlmH [Reinekea marinisedimentorum]|uniref:Ribosomal RNA large subunit methyltransferase H n=1 Tax=Reinekea marinisedimentorum TaxID=230495 RepID=A0A4R3I7D0_9GAMM|nr:23S rRNA (pseudouridine(1915)-N(3))-methyltransferase RlmH [Reinekea marinisedimentorum]TCS41680.1 23S rRNA (pseudouridine1915-N3)-methyltransferase [Reinekea marinisedimentorum]
MKIRIIAVGPKMPDWVNQGTGDYTKRMPREMPVEFVPLALGNRNKNSSVEKARQQEGDAMLAAIKDSDHVVALDLSGKPWSTEQLSDQLQNWRMGGKDLALLVGGPDGLDSRCLARANQKWALSNLTLPHPLVRVLLAEQLYRAWSITQNHPYHK